MNHEIEVQLTVNGVPRGGRVEPRKTLADFLRDDLGLTGTHLGCEQGVCGACTVLVDSQPVRSCLMFGVQADGSDVRTIEGVGDGSELAPLQQALADAHSFQCGFCTPGFVMQIIALLEEGPAPSEPQLRDSLSGNLCRCTGYESIIDGVLLAIDRMPNPSASH